MTIYDIAKRCGVSPATVSRVLNGTGPVRPEVAARVRQVVEESGYAPKPRPRRSQKTPDGFIGVLLPQTGHSYYDRVVRTLQQQLPDLDKLMVLLPVDPHSEDLWVSRLGQLPLDGVILLQEDLSPTVSQALLRSEIPAVMCGALSLTRSFPAVHVDDQAAAYDGISYLVSLGHRRIGLISDDPKDISSGSQRLSGCKKALADNGIVCPPGWIRSKGCTRDDGYHGARYLLTAHPELTAIFAFSDAAAYGAMKAAMDMGFQVPGEISILGFDDILPQEHGLPGLTCIHQPMEEIVSRTLALLQAEKTSGTAPVSVTLRHSIITRDSCSHPRNYKLQEDHHGSRD